MKITSEIPGITKKEKRKDKSFDFHTFISPRRDFHDKFHDNSVLESRFILLGTGQNI